MKKILLVFSLLLLALPAVVFAQVPPTTCTLVRVLTDINPACTAGAAVNIETFGMCCAINSLYVVINWIFIVLVAIAVVLFLMGAFTLVTAAGSPEKVAQGRNFILYAIVGLAVALLARAVPAVARALIGAT